MRNYIVHLIPRSSFEIGIHSDTIFGAICWGIRMLFGEERLTQVLDQFKTSPPFLMSSSFPCRIESTGYKYYLPKPYMKPLSLQELTKKEVLKKARRFKETYHADKLHAIEIAEKYKRFKKITFIGLTNFKKVLAHPDESILFADYLDGLLNEPVYCRSAISQKNSLDRITNSTAGAGNTFYSPEIAFRATYGLFFLLQTQDIDEYLGAVLRFLEDSGIGPNARTGKNWFNIKIEEKTLFNGTGGRTASSFITLSRYLKNEPIDMNNSYYHLESIRSKVESRLEFAGADIWKQRIAYITVGSVIHPVNKAPWYGRIAPVKVISGKTIYQYGYAYPVWLHAGGNHEV